MTMGIQWPHPMAKITLESIITKKIFVNAEMCEDLFPRLKSIATEPDMLGPPKFDSDGEMRIFQLGDVEKPFDLPFTVDLSQLIPEENVDLVVPIQLAPLYLVDSLVRLHENTKIQSSAFRKGLGGKTDHSPSTSVFWNALEITPIGTIGELMSVTTSHIDAEELLRKIKFEGVLEEDSERRQWFQSIVSEEDQHQFRCDFLLAVTEKTSLNYARDRSIKVAMSENTRDSTVSTEVDHRIHRIHIRACMSMIELPFCETKEDMRRILLGSLGQSTDLFTGV
jgi:hypothetical protein